MKMTEKYLRRLANYTHWCSGGFLMPPLQPIVPDGMSAEEAMFRWETHGEMNETCDPFTLALYKQGKMCRDWHISEWRTGYKQRLFVPEEFFGALGLRTRREFASIFGRELDTHILERLIRVVGFDDKQTFWAKREMSKL